MSLANDVIQYRTRVAKITQKEFCEMCGISETTLVNIEKGKNCSKLTEGKIRSVIGHE